MVVVTACARSVVGLSHWDSRGMTIPTAVGGGDELVPAIVERSGIKGSRPIPVFGPPAGRTGAQKVAAFSSRVRVSGQTATFCLNRWVNLHHREQAVVDSEYDAGISQAEYCVARDGGSEAMLVLGWQVQESSFESFYQTNEAKG